MEYCKIPFEQRWSDIENDLTKIMKNILEGKSQPSLECEDPMRLYTTIYDTCTQKPPHNYSQQLYDKYCEVIEDYTKHTVLPSLRENNDEEMLRDLVLRWSNHKVMVRWLYHFFDYLDRYFVSRKYLPTLKEAGFRYFDDLVYHEMHSKAIFLFNY